MALVTETHECGPYLIDLLRTNRYSLKELGYRMGRNSRWVHNHVVEMERRGYINVIRKRIAPDRMAQNKYEVLI